MSFDGVGEPLVGDAVAISNLNIHRIVLVLSRFATVLVLVIEQGPNMKELIFDHDRLGVYRLSIEYFSAAFAVSKS